jgi:hypothetical protein
MSGRARGGFREGDGKHWKVVMGKKIEDKQLDVHHVCPSQRGNRDFLERINVIKGEIRVEFFFIYRLKSS